MKQFEKLIEVIDRQEREKARELEADFYNVARDFSQGIIIKGNDIENYKHNSSTHRISCKKRMLECRGEVIHENILFIK